ncbi:invasion associated locus B family protein [Pseudoroseicyclus sp. H15]
MNRRKLSAALVAALPIGMGAGTGALAQSTGFPGGASSLSETHGDWLVSCDLRQGEADIQRFCVLSQEQVDSDGQRILMVELVPLAESLGGVVALPFGLDLAHGVGAQIDGADFGAPLAFSTCLGSGCLIPLDLGGDEVEAMMSGETLTLATRVFAGEELTLTVSLAGLASALARTDHLLN